MIRVKPGRFSYFTLLGLTIALQPAANSAIAQATELKVAVIRVEFQEDDSPATAGNGLFLTENPGDIICDSWALDPSPHNAQYFQDHLSFANHYWTRVSNDQVRVNTALSEVFPAGDQAYQLQHDMLHYHPYLEDFDETERLVQLVQDAVILADPDVDFSAFNTVMIAHAGMGGDFAFVLNPTPGNIPSAYMTADDLSAHGGVNTEEGLLDHAIIIPESQNFMQYEETIGLFEETSDPCFYQVALNGTITLMLGFHLGLPAMYDTEEGTSLIGGFGLMDQGSNNWHGVVPTLPNPYTRIERGWDFANHVSIGDSVRLETGANPVRVDLTPTEYFLIENRQRNLVDAPGYTLWVDSLGADTVSVLLGTSGVVIEVDELDAGIPGNGLLIWHIDESAEHTAENPNGGALQLVDLEEADGAQDMGHETQLLFADYLETGWWFDSWYAGNEGWFHLNRGEPIVGDSLLNFSSTTRPNTNANDGTPSHLRIENISKPGSEMAFRISSDRIQVPPFDRFMALSSSTENEIIVVKNDTLTRYLLGGTEFSRSRRADKALIDILLPDPSANIKVADPWLVAEMPDHLLLYNIQSEMLIRDSTMSTVGVVQFHGDGSMHSLGYASREAPFRAVLRYTSQMDPSEPPLQDRYFQASSRINPMMLPVYYTADTLYWVESTQYPLQPGAPGPIVTNSVDDIRPTFLDQDGFLSTGEEGLYQESTPVFSIIVDPDHDSNPEILSVFEDYWQIRASTGAMWDGSPVPLDGVVAVPQVADFLGLGEAQVLFRTESGYEIFSYDGNSLESGVLLWYPDEASEIWTLASGGSIYVVLGSENSQMLRFSNSDDHDPIIMWTGSNGRIENDRIVDLRPFVSTDPQYLDNLQSAYNYPNPVEGGETVIRAWVASTETWSIDIYSLAGFNIESYESDVLYPGYQEWTWDVSDISNGIYLANVTAGNQSKIIKIAVQK